MHEASIALAIAQEVCERAAHARVRRVAAVHVRVGVLTAVVPDALQFAWEAATDGTAAFGSQLHVERIPLAIYCEPCARERSITSGTLPVCPECGTSSARILRGRELLVTAMEVIDDAQTPGRAAEHTTQEQHAGA